jgi:hypothetical protein
VKALASTVSLLLAATANPPASEPNKNTALIAKAVFLVLKSFAESFPLGDFSHSYHSARCIHF